MKSWKFPTALVESDPQKILVHSQKSDLIPKNFVEVRNYLAILKKSGLPKIAEGNIKILSGSRN